MKKRNLARAAAAALAAGGVLAVPAIADAANACNSYPNPVYVAGSSAAKPILSALSVAIGSGVSIIYQSVSSCVGLGDVTAPPQGGDSSSAVYFDPTMNGAATACTTTGINVDVGVSDVYPGSCSPSIMVPQGEKEFQGPIQAMTMAGPKASNETSISADAAYVVFGFGGSMYQVTPWTDPMSMFIRTTTSGTETMIGAAIGLPPSKWKGVQETGSGNVLTALTGASNAQAAIGILSTQFADPNRAMLKELAYQHTGQDCGYLPDSDATHFDKLNVRQGRYAIWGPLHFVANVDNNNNPIPAPNNPNSTGPATLVQYVTFDSMLTDMQTDAMIKAATKAYTIPQCAMEVMRTGEIGAEASFQPPKPCGCYFESIAQTTPTSSYCKTCGGDADCADAGNYTHCRYGYCEAQ